LQESCSLAEKVQQVRSDAFIWISEGPPALAPVIMLCFLLRKVFNPAPNNLHAFLAAE
jgi:hypothetical protein